MVLQRGKSFPEGLMHSFAYDDPALQEPPQQKGMRVRVDATTRQKIVLVNEPANEHRLKIRSMEAKGKKTAWGTKRTKSPVKKSTTITNLATSHYFGHDGAEDESPMMQYLSATQAQVGDVGDSGQGCEVKVAKHKATSTKRNANAVKPRVTSPKTALKFLDAQQTIFGSASQLVADEIPAIRPQADPVLTQATQPISIRSTTPKSARGTSKYAKTRNLWSVSARDDDNALLYVDTVDLDDTPELMGAFAGKLSLAYPPSPTKPHRAASTHGDSVLDIDDFSLVPAVTTTSTFRVPYSRSLHTLSRPKSPGVRQAKPGEAALEEQHHDTRIKPDEGDTDAVNEAIKASLQEMSTEDLRKQLALYGLKRFRKRENMIKALEEHFCGPGGGVGTETALKHGDFLSNLHDVSIRPEAKVRKPRKRKKEEEGGNSPKKFPKRQTKKQDVEGTESEPRKKGRKKKGEAIVVSEIDVIDVDDALRASEVSTIVKERIKTSQAQAVPEAKTVPPTIASDAGLVDMVGSEEAHSKPTMENSLGPKIHAAILRESEDSMNSDRNHVKDPTWHEKILLYDPIVLEDLATWLNTKGLALVDEDGEVSAFEVKEWCESNGICCLWRGGWRGQKSKV
jgi:hypothetical protein